MAERSGSSNTGPAAYACDPSRLDALASFEILDTAPEAAFDDVVLLASELCNTAIATVTFVTGDRQWFKARTGTDMCQAPIHESICNHALSSPDLLVIPDLTADVRTVDNPLVTSGPLHRFYAGAPLRTPCGATLGTICVIDPVARPQGLTARQAKALRALARQVMHLLEQRRDRMERQGAVQRQEALIETQRLVSAAAGNLDGVLDAVLLGAMRAMPNADGGAVLMRLGEDASFRAAKGGLIAHVGFCYPLKSGLVGSCLLSGTAILCLDAELDARVDHVVAERIGLRSCVIVPIVRQGDLIGALLLQSAEPEAFTDRDLRLAQLFVGASTAGFMEASEAEARRSIRASEARYRTVFDSAIDYAIVVMDLDGKVTDWNEGATRILGWTPEEVRGKPADVFFTPDDREAGIPGEEMRSALDVGRGNDERWHVRKDGRRFWANGEMMALRNDDDEAIGFLKILRDRTEQRAGVARLQASEARLRTIVETVPVGILFAEAPSGRIVGRNGRMQEIVGVASDAPKAIGDYGQWRSFHADGRLVEAHEYPLARVIRGGLEEDSLEVHYERGDGSRIWIELTAAPVRDDDGSVAGAVVAVSDIDSRKRAEVAQNFMNDELSHRMKNLMAIVLSITSQTMRSATDVAIAREVLSDRLITLSKAHDILLGGPSERAPLADIVRSALGSYADDGDRIEIGGPPVVIGQRAALALAMMVHELTTNAAKYGALSRNAGHVGVSWSLIDGSRERDLRIEWRETRGPKVETPTSKGFGSRLIERGLTGHVGGSVTINYAASGLVCVVQAPLEGFQRDG